MYLMGQINLCGRSGPIPDPTRSFNGWISNLMIFDVGHGKGQGWVGRQRASWAKRAFG